MKNLINLSFSSETGSVLRDDRELTLFAKGEQLDGNFYVFSVDQPISLDDFLVLSYRCTGLRRLLLRRAPLMWAKRKDELIPLVHYDDLSFDSKPHQLAVRVPSGEYDGLLIRFSIDRRTKANWTFTDLFTCSYDELPKACSDIESGEAHPYRIVDISDQFNAEFAPADADCFIDGGLFFADSHICLNGIPFEVRPNGMNIIKPQPGPIENDDEILNFGVPARRRLCRPISRDSLIRVPIHAKVTEVFFLMSLDGRRHQRWNFATDGTILGAPDGEVMMPLTVYDVEGFVVEIIYADGRRDTAMPYNLNRRRHIVQGDFSAYAIPSDGSMVDEVVFHNRLIDSDLSLIAVTVNDGEDRQFPLLLNPVWDETIEHTVPQEKGISLEENILTVANHAIELKIDATRAMTLLSMKNAFVPLCTVAPAPMLRIANEQRRDCAQIALKDIVLNDASADVRYLCTVDGDEPAALMVTVRISICEDNAVRFCTDVVNVGESDTRIAVQFPVIQNMTFGDIEDAWYFVPKYQDTLSNENIFMYEESAPSYPMQYMDIFSKKQQGGLSLTTQERDIVVRKYALEKDETGISFYVEYPHMYGQLPVGAARKLSPTVFTAHEGDWRTSYAIYKEWLDSWYTPYKCQDKTWYRRCFWLLAEITDFFETKSFTKFPVWVDPETKKCNFLDVMEEQKSLTGVYPDILHLWSWAYYEDRKASQWGNFGGEDYEIYGGQEAFRNALRDVQDKTGCHVSLYLHPTLLSARYPQSKKFFPKLRVINDQGNYISIAEDSFRMCHANETWRDFAINFYPRVYKELDIPLLYVDEFSLRIENRCYADGHGHSIPSNLLKTDRDFITRLKDTMPEEVVLYGEYAAVDINARYIDCNISYSYLDAIVDIIETAWRGDDGDDRMSRIYLDTYRFAFPKIVQLNLPMAMRNLSWHPQKFIFFNGEAIYDSFWDIEESAGHDFTIKAYKLKKQYADCFSSDHPATMIDTLSPVICANAFPGEGRTLYTLYNRGYQTYRGKALRVPHKPGNRYYDAWNDRELVYAVSDGYADLSVEIDAMQMGCVVVLTADGV